MNRYKEIAQHYIATHRENAKNERKLFKLQRTFSEAIIRAALAKMHTGKRFSHQRRIPKEALLKCKSILLKKKNELYKISSFESLHYAINKYIGCIRGIGKLMVYDTAFRLGGFLELEPKVIFLHTGTEIGAKKLGLSAKKEYLKMKELPREFHILKPYEIEDVLCIYKYKFKNEKALTSECS